MTTWTDLTSDIRLLILSRLPLRDAISLSQASPNPQHSAHVRARIARLQPLRDAWVTATSPALRAYANPSALSTPSARRAVAPAEFACLTCLPLGGAQLTSLAGVSEVRALRVLDVSRNLLEEVDEELAMCSELRVLHLGRNRLRSFPGVVRRLPELRTLLLHHNRIVRLPEEWSELAHLYRIGLFDCAIRGPLPEQLCEMLGTQTEQRRRRSANLQRNRLDQGSVVALFRKFPLMASAVVI